MPGARSISTGIWVGVGGRDEPAGLAGASHFLEHLLFKGTSERSAAAIAEAVDAVGGEMNAYTTLEYTAFDTRLPVGHLDLGLDLLCDVVSRPAFRPADLEAERQVILEELLMEEDTPDDRVLGVLAEAQFPDHPLGREVLGTRATISSIDATAIRAFHGEWYRPANLVVACAGAVDHAEVVAGVGRRLGGLAGGRAPDRSPPTAAAEPLRLLRRRTEQVHLAIGARALARHDPDRSALAVANQILGGGLSSRLFQEIRERRGLVYSVYSDATSWSDTGTLVVYAATAPGRAAEVLGLLHGELDRLARSPVTARELEVAVGALAGSTVLGLEDSGSRMARIGKALLVDGTVAGIDQLVERFLAVTVDDVARAVERVLGPGERTVAVIGPVAKRDLLPRRAA
ncbi:MAG: FIG007959: peptidase, M16 family [uncultured Acidimicrobiales bacterium]|uniref:FIG007959: peptidase, M16 family n=1 Tax=uncultured Acidimicrobiales bacterium TaxID=310071 RepID=A0A6J4HHU3_9ACTN|nr:MAG: FIG007959: peptidase, M16 family [uncultured Acidimicrobiales bacterium]